MDYWCLNSYFKSEASIQPEQSLSNFKNALSITAYLLALGLPRIATKNSSKSTQPSLFLSRASNKTPNSSFERSTWQSRRPVTNSYRSTLWLPSNESIYLNTLPKPRIVLLPRLAIWFRTLSRPIVKCLLVIIHIKSGIVKSDEWMIRQGSV